MPDGRDEKGFPTGEFENCAELEIFPWDVIRSDHGLDLFNDEANHTSICSSTCDHSASTLTVRCSADDVTTLFALFDTTPAGRRLRERRRLQGNQSSLPFQTVNPGCSGST
jgi:hypothetical protein